MPKSVNTKKLAEILVSSTKDATGEELSQTVKTFVSWLKKNNLLRFWRDIESDIDRVWKQQYGASKVTLTSAHPLTEAAQKTLEQLVRGAEVKHTTDEDLIGGAILRIDDTRVDGSIAGKLERLKSTLES